MFSWYRNASRCYVYLVDVSVPQHQAGSKAGTRYIWEDGFRKSRWFTRGWTLQELLAPASVEFFSSEGTRLGDKKSLEDIIHEITDIPRQALRGSDMAPSFMLGDDAWRSERKVSPLPQRFPMIMSHY
ncbi:hypothetical protein BU24DRAFT_115082 [Aaosphaeria arxii CBS 175.79]|uniref:HET-domain-containing protein n=1 Tax=Aaosphaeria arxii CBS 175.79 TaxID=1450172 RepID=A0A6A5Y144_9PLEO|nr:uncharacterized protein BU24DRAFT_115082 [Aaosphaeria arxii CBS 175.79]KAF2019218.1 hypothetical protein BU24DRAFT_115082 [Aaosphaeria arxii CBS 175.79]